MRNWMRYCTSWYVSLLAYIHPSCKILFLLLTMFFNHQLQLMSLESLTTRPPPSKNQLPFACPMWLPASRNSLKVHKWSRDKRPRFLVELILFKPNPFTVHCIFIIAMPSCQNRFPIIFKSQFMQLFEVIIREINYWLIDWFDLCCSHYVRKPHARTYAPSRFRKHSRTCPRCSIASPKSPNWRSI